MLHNAAVKVAKLTGALGVATLLPWLTFVIYTDRNMHQNLFVPLLGCGCGPFPNTNHLSLLVSGSALFFSGLICWHASNGFPGRWRTRFRIFVGIASLWFLHFFMLHNAWL